MEKISRLIPTDELPKYDSVFLEEGFLKPLEQENVANQKPLNSKTATIIHADEEKGIVREVSRYVQLSNNKKLLLVKLTNESNQKSTHIVYLWEKNDKETIVKEYVDSELVLSSSLDEDESKESNFNDEPFEGLTESIEEKQLEALYDPTTCVNQGQCCRFSGQTYQHCGKYCGIGHTVGGGAAINSLDVCCRSHDSCLKVSNKTRCRCHDEFLDCARGITAPGDTTIRTGIRAQKILDRC